MENSYHFFTNKECIHFPCHEGIEEFNCLFCYCPLYHIKNCPGNPGYIEKEGNLVKACDACCFPHRPENYDIIVGILKSLN